VHCRINIFAIFWASGCIDALAHVDFPFEVMFSKTNIGVQYIVSSH
jgi:hypothetical protein